MQDFFSFIFFKKKKGKKFLFVIWKTKRNFFAQILVMVFVDWFLGTNN